MWKIYYDDGSSINGPCDLLPHRRVGIIAIAEPDEDHNWTFWYGRDWYLLQNNGSWMGVDLAGLFDQITFRFDHIAMVLQGRSVAPYSKYQSVIDRMIKECKPAKTGWHAGE